MLAVHSVTTSPSLGVYDEAKTTSIVPLMVKVLISSIVVLLYEPLPTTYLPVEEIVTFLPPKFILPDVAFANTPTTNSPLMVYEELVSEAVPVTPLKRASLSTVTAPVPITFPDVRQSSPSATFTLPVLSQFPSMVSLPLPIFTKAVLVPVILPLHL